MSVSGNIVKFLPGVSEVPESSGEFVTVLAG